MARGSCFFAEILRFCCVATPENNDAVFLQLKNSEYMLQYVLYTNMSAIAGFVSFSWFE